MRKEPDFEGLPLTTPLTVAELAAHARKKGGNWPTQKMRRYMLRLNRAVIKRHEETGDPRWSAVGFLKHTGPGGHYYIASLTDMRTKTGWDGFLKTVWSTRDADAIAGDAKTLRREVRALQGRVRELELVSDRQTTALKEATRLLRDIFQNRSRGWMLRKAAESGLHMVVPERGVPVESFEDADEDEDDDREDLVREA
jgi:hypothetical protein